MKKFGWLFVGICVLLVAGCREAREAAKLADAKVRGEWRVVMVNCPEVLGERNGERMTFEFHLPHGATPYTKAIEKAKCREVDTTWTVWVDRTEWYSFFPPTQKRKEVK